MFLNELTEADIGRQFLVFKKEKSEPVMYSQELYYLKSIPSMKAVAKTYFFDKKQTRVPEITLSDAIELERNDPRRSDIFMPTDGRFEGFVVEMTDDIKGKMYINNPFGAPRRRKSRRRQNRRRKTRRHRRNA